MRVVCDGTSQKTLRKVPTMKKMKSHLQTAFKFLLIIAVLMTALPLAAMPAHAASGDTLILYTANLRGNIDVLPQIAQLKAQYESEGSEVVLVDTGNYLQGTVYATNDSGKSVVELMDAAGYDVVAIGSHEFDFGTGKIGVDQHEVYYQDGTLGQFLNEASFTAVSANLMTATLDGTKTAYEPNTVIASGSLQLGFFGLTDPNIVNQVLENNLAGSNLTLSDPVTTAAAQNAAIAADVKIALSNAGNLSADAADVVIDISAEAGFIVGKIVLNSSGQVVSSETVSLSGIEQDASVKAAVDTYKAIVDEIYLPSDVAQSNVTLKGANAAVRGGQTNLGDFWTDALLWFAKEGGIADYYGEDDIAAGNTGISVPAENIVAVWNSGNLRDYVNTGDVIMKDLQRVLPYPNSVAVVYLTGSQLLELLESATQALPWSAETNSANAAFLNVAGLKYTVDTDKVFDKGEQYGSSGNWFEANSLNRVTVSEINGKALDEDALYAVITSNAIYNGMDSNYICADKDPDRSTITSAVVRDVVWLYLTQKLDGVIGTEYAQPQGRVTILSSGSAGWPFIDVDLSDGKWYNEAVKFVYDNGFMVGTDASRFAPGDTLTRAQMAQILFNIEGKPQVGDIEPFSDVAEGIWYYDAVCWAQKNDIVNGYGDNKFGPGNPLTREQMVVILFNYVKYKGYDTTAHADIAAYTDADNVSEWARDTVCWAVAKGVINGTSDTTLSPQGISTRAQIAQIIKNYFAD